MAEEYYDAVLRAIEDRLIEEEKKRSSLVDRHEQLVKDMEANKTLLANSDGRITQYKNAMRTLRESLGEVKRDAEDGYVQPSRPPRFALQNLVRPKGYTDVRVVCAYGSIMGEWIYQLSDGLWHGEDHLELANGTPIKTDEVDPPEDLLREDL